jgi:GxxExxY protein
VQLGDGFRADLIVEGLVIVEVKSLESVPPVAYKVLLTYLRLSNLRLGLLMNFGSEYMKDGIQRVVNRL